MLGTEIGSATSQQGSQRASVSCICIFRNAEEEEGGCDVFAGCVTVCLCLRTRLLTACCLSLVYGETTIYNVYKVTYRAREVGRVFLLCDTMLGECLRYSGHI